MQTRSPDSNPAPMAWRLRLAAALALAAALGACGGSGGSDGSTAATSGSSDQATVVVTPNDPATAGPSAEALTPPGASTDTSTTTPARRPETVRCAP